MSALKVPGRNPIRYCRLCLTQVNILKVFESPQTLRQPEKDLLQKMFHYTRITFHNLEDYPSAVCYECIDKFNDFHEFRRMILRNHNTVKSYRKEFGDELDESQVEEEALIEVIDSSELVDIKQELVDIKQELDEYEDSKLNVINATKSDKAKETVKEVDVYHLDGELRNVVVKEEKSSPDKSLSVTDSSVGRSPGVEIVKKSSVLPTIHVLNKNVPIIKRPSGTVLNSEHLEKRTKLATGHGFTIVKCTQCRAVFRNRENLIIHERNDHPAPLPTKIVSPKKAAPPIGTGPKSPTHSSQQPTLFKCTHCSNSFIHEPNFKKHMQTCKPGLLAKLNPQITIKRASPMVMTESKAPVAKADDQVVIRPLRSKEEISDLIRIKKEETEDQRIRCHYCPLTYKTKYFLKKHMLDVHKIDDYEDVFYCHVCKLNYSCNEDLQLHNRAIHRFQCKQCLEDFRTCMHSQIYAKSTENGINKGT